MIYELNFPFFGGNIHINISLRERFCAKRKRSKVDKKIT